MLKFDVDHHRFNCRSAAVIVHDGYVLMHRSAKDEFWALPGGRVEFFEHADATVEREIQEELGLKAKVVRLLWHVENFFEYQGAQFHELSNYFLTELVEVPDIKPEQDFPGIEAELDLIFRWVPVEKLSGYVLKPDFLQQGILTMPTAVEYLKIDELGS